MEKDRSRKRETQVHGLWRVPKIRVQQGSQYRPGRGRGGPELAARPDGSRFGALPGDGGASRPLGDLGAAVWRREFTGPGRGLLQECGLLGQRRLR